MNEYTILNLNWTNSNGINYLSFYAVENDKKDYFISNSEHILRSLDAKELYVVKFNDYKSDPKHHQLQVNLFFNEFLGTRENTNNIYKDNKRNSLTKKPTF